MAETGNPNDLRQQLSMVKLLADALDQNAKNVPARVNAKRVEMDASLGAAWQGEARRAFDVGANLMQQRVQEVANKVAQLSEGVLTAGNQVASGDGQQSDTFRGMVSQRLGAS